MIVKYPRCICTCFYPLKTYRLCVIFSDQAFSWFSQCQLSIICPTPQWGASVCHWASVCQPGQCTGQPDISGLSTERPAGLPAVWCGDQAWAAAGISAKIMLQFTRSAHLLGNHLFESMVFFLCVCVCVCVRACVCVCVCGTRFDINHSLISRYASCQVQY